MSSKPKDKVTVQGQLFPPTAEWFHMFKEMIRSEVWAKFSPAAKALYPALKTYTNRHDGYAFPSFDTLECKAGLSRASVSKAIKELEELGYIRKEKHGTGRSSTTYRLVEKFALPGADGQPSEEVATFDYLPGLVREATAELKNFVARGMTDAGKLQFIHIEKLNLTINHAGRDVIAPQGDVNVAPPDPHLEAAERWRAGELTDEQYFAEVKRLMGLERGKPADRREPRARRLWREAVERGEVDSEEPGP